MEDLQLLNQNGIESIKTLGQGAFGRVYLSYHNELGIIAAKVMKIEKFDKREWDAAGALSKPGFVCPFIMKYLLARQFQNEVVILMEYANAKSLDSIVKDKTQYLTSATYRALSKQILEGIRMVHAVGLIHRDIKPENIMMHSANGNIIVKIADFGLAKVMLAGQMGVTSYGTPLNMAPELVVRTVMATNKVDIYSVGTVLFQLATHEYPIKAMNVPDLQSKIKNSRIDRHPALKDDLQWDFLSKLLEFDPNKRLSAEQALQHPYFTSPQALAEITPEIIQITQNGVNSNI
ncbi:MAG: putative SNF1A/AMP-activated protein kinase [Streblomastix strix]|uniref:Putative SNF1A/AMP-activated protein kinase n=1 Tax=Streblomastix strix TaxID=222440 RepID=A0A5J4VQ17_9EUKA|nr:MAG: putative SNF1A/AMP-activated protein kinase [Streblomastix strix]